ncbi:helix-turn-helix transcriptional regulator [Bacillus sp. FJAT-49736]|uniref:ArsR/SmtB family transcription factor n=1 Tax=Bacillus sp. FJAT-49736 TaxID=2833582 RepID=UPI001BCA3161|nr:helix-turn-helix transcriptional regulator [Bacillus sp. FJAT-49736]MBS4172339.1 helix-turn-helix domain-containing protein [Bacillus sp. FJAT-49736]
MNTNPNIAKVASLVSEPSRAAILTTLLDDRFHTASELAYQAGIKQQTASFHLAKLAELNMVIIEHQGRHRYYRLANSEIAEVLESLLALSPPVEIKSLKQSTEMKALKYARTCYDHLAGKLGVELTKGLIDIGYIEAWDKEFAVTVKGEQFFSDFQIDLELLKTKKRKFSLKCIDWSERHYHLGGALGNAILNRMLELKWIERHPKTRAIKVTDNGAKEMKKLIPSVNLL